MATYFVRKTGNDASAGTSAGTAWRTIGKALGAAGIASGDTVYVGAGVYRESVTIAMTSATAETKVVADVSGEFTGDAGEVIWTAYSAERSAPSSSPVSLSGRDFLTFENFIFIRPFNAVAISATTATSTNITIRNCTFANFGTSSNAISITVGFGVTAVWVIEGCQIVSSFAAAILVTLTTGVGADYDSNIQIRNCAFFGGGVSATNSGTAANEGGGVDVVNCTFLCVGACVATTGTRVSLTIPNTVTNSVCLSGGTGLSAGEAGALTEDYNIVLAVTARTNVTAGTHSVVDGSYAVMAEVGQEYYRTGRYRPFLSPMRLSPLFGFGGSSPPSTDLTGIARGSGCTALGTAGTATSGGTRTLTNTGATWATDEWLGWTVKVISGTGSGQTKSITSNTATVLTVDGNWNTQPDNTSVYEIYWGSPSSTGTATAGAASTLTDGNAGWPTNSWAGYTVEITSGTGSGQTRTVGSNTGTVLTNTTTWTTNPDNTSVYRIYRGTGIDAVNTTVGCYERMNTAAKETGTVDDGSSGLMIQGPGLQEFLIPVSAASTTIEVAARFNSEYTPGTKPKLQIVANGAIGVAATSDTMTSAADTWETLSVNFTPTAAGVVKVQFISAATKPAGRAYFDTFTVT